jgi:tetratricopeptide (TPR) repeat protein
VPPLRSRLEAAVGALAEGPAVLLAGLGLATILAITPADGGYRPGSLYAAALFELGLLVVALLALPRARRAVRPVRIACACLAGYAAWSYLSIAWADQKGDAWDGANRTALYALIFALFALWPLRGRVAAALIGAYAGVIAVMGLVTLTELMAAADPSGHFIDGRFAEPIRYANADAALWSSAFFPCIVLASRRAAAPALRGLLVAAAVLLGGLALMGQSRGWLFALPVVFLVFAAVTPKRVRTSLTLLLAAAGVALTIPAVVDVYDESGRALARAVDSAGRAILLAAVAAGAVAFLTALPDRRVTVSREGGRRLAAALAAVALLAAFAGTAVYVAERGSPFSDIAHAWNQFKTKKTPHGGASRLGRLGSNRYDFWRVAVREFGHAPIAGIGADNYQEAYLRHGKSAESPLYPHSVELRTLAQTGLVGALLLGAALVAACVAAGRAMRRRTGWGAAAAASGVGAFAYWLVHGSVDWLWEFPALGGAAFALVGIAAGLAPRRTEPPASFRRPLAGGPVAAAIVGAVGLLLVLSFGAPWLADRYSSQAARIWGARPARAFDRLDTAAGLNPLSPRPKLLAGAIALRLDRPRLAERYYREAVDRDPNGGSAYLELGAIVYASGRRPEGARLLARAAELQPRDEVTARVLRRARRGGRVDIEAMNDALRRRTAKLGR